jgi:hypothetical protein
MHTKRKKDKEQRKRSNKKKQIPEANEDEEY